MKALLIVDIQNDYFPGGKAELVNPEAALANAEKLLRLFRDRKRPVIIVQHVSTRKDSPFFIPDTDGVNIHPRLAPLAGERLIQKNFPSAFLKTDLAEYIKDNNISELVVCGMMTHMCIDTTVRDAMNYGVLVALIADACATRDLTFDGAVIPAAQVQAAYIAALSGSFATVENTDVFIRGELSNAKENA